MNEDAMLDFEVEEDAAASSQNLLADLSRVGDFPALSQVISQVNRISSSENSRTDELTEAILRDVSLTNKLLRIVNSAHFGQFGGRAINTVSRAIVILGYNTIRDTALALMLFEHLNDHAQASELKGESVESFFCGILGRGLAARAGVRDTEEVFICALFRNLGRMMCRLHFYERSKEVQALMENEHLPEDVASRRVFGVSYDDFGQALGHHWHLPNPLLQGMAPLEAGPIKAPANETARVRALANMAQEIYLTTRDTAPEKLEQAIAAIGRKYGQAISIPQETLVDTVFQAGQTMAEESRVLQVDVKTSPMLRRLLQGDGRPDARADAPETAAEAAAEPTAETEAGVPSSDPTSILITGLQDLTSMMLGNFRPTDLLHVAAELLYRSQCFDRVIIGTIAPSGKELVGRIGFGAEADTMKRAMRIPLGFTADVFHAAISKGVDVLIADTRADNIRNRIPAWYAEHIGAKSFLLLPISLNNRIVALVYGDKAGVSLSLPSQTLGLIKSVRNQIALALRQKGTG